MILEFIYESEKTLREMGKCWLPPFSTSPKFFKKSGSLSLIIKRGIFQKASFFKLVQIWVSVVKCKPVRTCTILNTSNLYTTMTTFDTHQEKSLVKTLWEKEKMLMNSIFSYSNNVFLTFRRKVAALEPQ